MDKTFLKKVIKGTLLVLPLALVAGLLMGIYTYSHFDQKTQTSIISQMGSYKTFLLVTGLQSGLYAVIATFIGTIVSNSIGLLRPLKFQKKVFMRVFVISVMAGAIFSLDYFLIAPSISQVAADYAKGISLPYFLGCLLYGGIIEELMLRLFFMSLLAFIIWKIFARKYSREEIPIWVYVMANIVTAVAFSAGHLPTSVALFGTLTPLIIIRCFVLNGGFGLIFGLFYRKYGIQYAMESHFLLHFISKLFLICVL